MSNKINALINDDLKNRFEYFVTKVVTERYTERWKSLFYGGKWNKINPWDAWEDNFTLAKKTEWKDGLEKLISHILDYGIDEITFIGLGHNLATVEKCSVNNMIDIMKSNIEGLYITNNKDISIITNHDGEIMIIDSSKS